MKKTLIKLFLGEPGYNTLPKHSAYQNYVRHLRDIWNNKNHHDVGLEKIVRLFLLFIQVIFPGMHIRNYFGKKGIIIRSLANEAYVLLKVVLPLVFLSTGLYNLKIVVWFSFYLLMETICYVASLIFVSDIFVKPRSYRRNILMLFLNYLEIAACFAVIYGGLHLLNDKAKGITDFLYFSIVTSTTVGYGDIHPATHMGKIIACIHSLLTISFIVLFLNFFSSKVETLHNSEDLI